MKLIIRKTFLLALIFVSLFISTQSAKAQERITLDPEIIRQTSFLGRIQKIIIIPVKRSGNNLVSDEKIAAEMAYYFPRNGLRGSTVNYVILDDGKYFEIDPNFQLNLSPTNIANKEVAILWGYKDKFDLQNSEKQISTLKQLINEKLNSQSDLTSLNEIEIRNFSFVSTTESVTLSFGAINELSPLLQEKLGKEIDFSKKDIGNFEITKVSDNQNQPPNETINVEIAITNTLEKNIFLGKTQALTIKASGDSPLFVSDNWLNTRTPLYDDSSYLSSKSSKTYTIKFKTPIMPGDYKNKYTFYLNDKLIKEFEIPLTVADVGQKVLQITPNYYGYLTVRSEASLTSSDIGRAPSRSNYIFTEQANGFYKIDFNGREGWVYGKNVKVIK